MNVLDRIRAAFRAFVLGPALVTEWDRAYGHDVETFSPPSYGEYIATSNAVYTCASQRAQFLASLPLRLYRRGRDGVTEVNQGRAVELLSRVNPFWTFSRLMEMTELSLCLWGQAFWFLERGQSGRQPPREIWWGRPDRVRVIPDPTEYIGGYLYYPQHSAEPIRYQPGEVIWLRYANPLDEYAPLSPLAAARLAADYASAAMKSNRALFEQGLQMGGIVVPKAGQVLSQEQAQAIEESLSRRFKGADKAHRWGVFRLEVEMKPMGITPKDAEFLDGLKFSLEEVCRAYKWPLDLVGGQRTYENVDAAMKAAWINAILPEARFIATEITEQLLPMFPGDADYAEFDVSDIHVLQDDQESQWRRAEGQIRLGALLINEWREQNGLEPVPWGDAWWAPMTVAPVRGEAVSGGNGNGNDGEGKRSHRAVLYGSPEHERLWNAFIRRTEPWEREFAQAVIGLFQRQRDSVISRLKANGPEATAAEPFDRARWIKQFRLEARPILERIIRESAQDALDELGLHRSQRQFLQAILTFLERRVQRFAQRVCETTWEQLKASLSDGIRLGENIAQLIERVMTVMQDRIRSTPETIARTEVMGAANGGRLLAWQESGVVKAKTWLAALDERTRPTHVEAHGQTVGLYEDFVVGAGSGPAPGQIGLPEEDINCRCTMTAAVEV